MNKALIFIYAFLAFMIVNVGIIVYLVTKPPVKCFHDFSEYQLTIEDDHIIVEDYGRTVTVLPLDSTCNLGPILIDDNQ